MRRSQVIAFTEMEKVSNGNFRATMQTDIERIALAFCQLQTYSESNYFKRTLTFSLDASCVLVNSFKPCVLLFSFLLL